MKKDELESFLKTMKTIKNSWKGMNRILRIWKIMTNLDFMEKRVRFPKYRSSTEFDFQFHFLEFLNFFRILLGF